MVVPELMARRRRSSLVSAAALACLGLAPTAARADAASDGSVAQELMKPNELRSGLVFGVGLGAGIAGASGYPNSYTKIGVPSYYDGSDAMGGGGGAIFALGALTDYLNFGVFYSRANFKSGNWSSIGGGGGFRIEFFPLYTLVPKLRDLGIYGQFGVGTSTLTPTSGTQEAATGTESFIGAGAFYEFFLGKAIGGHFGIGPSVEFDSQLTQANQRFSGLVGGRIAFYTGK